MIKKVFTYMKKYHMIEAGDTVIAGVSGGADSVCLLFVLLELRKEIPFHLAVVHVNHQIREDADSDAAYVKQLCDRADVPFHLVEKDVRAFAKKQGLSEEEAGRRIRYQAFEELLQREGVTLDEEDNGKEVIPPKGKIAVAHHANDRAETMLFQLFRGSGLTGAGGMKPVNGQIIRPLLCLKRSEIEDFLIQNKITWRTDVTNASDDYARNRIRHHILPFAEEYICKGAVEHMNRAAEDLQAAEAFIRAETVKAKKRCLHSMLSDEKGDKREVRLCISALQKEDSYIQRRVLLSCLEDILPGRKDITSGHIADIEKLLKSGGSKELHLPYKLTVVKEYDALIFKWGREHNSFCKNEQSISVREYELPISGKIEIAGLGTVEAMIFSNGKTENIPRKTYTKWFDYDKITTSACFRVRRTGDYLTINDRLSQKSLQDYFVNEKIPKGMRDSFYVLADGAHIMWVPGYRISEYYKVSEHTKTILQVEVIRDTEEERSHGNG